MQVFVPLLIRTPALLDFVTESACASLARVRSNCEKHSRVFQGDEKKDEDMKPDDGKGNDQDLRQLLAEVLPATPGVSSIS